MTGRRPEPLRFRCQDCREPFAGEGPRDHHRTAAGCASPAAMRRRSLTQDAYGVWRFA